MKSFIPVSFFEAWKLDGLLYSAKNTITLNDDPGKSTLDVFPYLFSNFSTTYSFGDTERHTDHWEINAGFGNDIINAAASTENNILLGGVGNDEIIGGSGDDRLDGGLGDDALTGNDGADTFVMSQGHDIVNDLQFEKVVIDFEDVPNNGYSPYPLNPAEYPYFQPIENGYMGLNWVDAIATTTEGTSWDGTGFPNLQADGMIMYDYDRQGLSFSDPDNDFNLEQASLVLQYTDASTTGTVKVTALDDGVTVGTVELELNEISQVIDFTNYNTDSNRFTSIDEVTIDCIETGADDDWVGVNDIVLSYGDVVDAPDGCDVDAMIASAVDNGDGGSIITCGDATMELVGVPPAELDAAMFV